MKIAHISVREILDSRDKQTIEVALEDEAGHAFQAQVPSGKSTGSREARVFAFVEAEKAVQEIERSILGKQFEASRDLDKFLMALDGTPRKGRLGGNVLLGISVAFVRMRASREGKEIWETLRGEFFQGKNDAPAPLIFSNLINGGEHAGNNLNIQEYMVVVRSVWPIQESVRQLKQFYYALGNDLLRSLNGKPLALGDEKGYSLDFENNFAPLEFLDKKISELELSEFRLGIDAAATSFFKDGRYDFEGKLITPDELSTRYEDYFSKLPRLYSIEDPFHENDEEGFRKLQSKFPERLIVGDDLTTTNPEVIERCARAGSIQGVIIKPNQIGTVSETCDAIRVAEQNGAQCIISHRSGETPDAFIIHLARACNAHGVKIGAPAGERLLKFSELIRLYDEQRSVM